MKECSYPEICHRFQNIRVSFSCHCAKNTKTKLRRRCLFTKCAMQDDSHVYLNFTVCGEYNYTCREMILAFLKSFQGLKEYSLLR